MKTIIKDKHTETSLNQLDSSFCYSYEELSQFVGMQQLRSGCVVGGPEFKKALIGKSKSTNLARISSLIERANQQI